MRRKKQIAGIIAIVGSLLFVIIVFTLQHLESTYNPAIQHMSELALGPYGFMMALAFTGFGSAVFSVQAGLRYLGATLIWRLPLIVAAICLFGAGLFKLDAAPILHISLIAVFFVLLVVVMYLLPRTAPQFNTWPSRLASWGLAAGTALSVFLGGSIPDGIAQRMAAACILIWLIWVGWRIVIAKERTFDHGSK